MRKPRFLLLASLICLSGALALRASPTPAPTATPTPRPRLSGGFGRPAATPAGGAESATTSSSQNPNRNEVVRAAEEGKSRKEGPGVAITNDSLVTDPRKGKITTSSPRNLPPPTASKSSEPVKAAAVTPAAVAVPAASTAGTEEEWRERARSARNRVDELKQRVGQLEAESKKLENDFYSWDDGSYRDGVIKPAWDRKKEDLETARKELTQAEADLADLPEKARKAGALPGWLRE